MWSGRCTQALHFCQFSARSLLPRWSSTIQNLEFTLLSWLGTCVYVKQRAVSVPSSGSSILNKSFATSVFTICGFIQLGKYNRNISSKIFFWPNNNLWNSKYQEEGLQFLCKTNAITFVFFQNLSLAFNFCLCHDLIQTLKDPFYPGKRRMTRYFFGSIVFAAVITGFSKNEMADKCLNQNNPTMGTDNTWYSS